MDKRLWGEITALAYMVQRGKPASAIPIKKNYSKQVKEYIIGDCGLNVYIQDLSQEWITLWIYKYSHIQEVIRSLNRSPQTIFDHWVQGKLFGYDESAIEEFLNPSYVER